MSLFDLKSLVSKEDFADAHEPLNDGIKEVPNAQTVAASVGTGDVGKDTTSPGPAKVVPEKPDTDEATKTEHNVVKESAEKKGSTPAAAPAAKPFPPKKEETDKPAGDKAPPFTPKDGTADKAEDDTAETELEHTSEKVAKDDLEKTEKAKEALEAYAPKAKRFDIIGHPTRQAEQIGKAIGFVQRRSGVKGEVTVSAESIDGAIALSQTRLAKLEREVRILGQRRVSAEDISDSMGIDNPPLVEEIAVTEAPTEHGAPPMEPAAAAALTEAELDPLDVPILEIQRVQETLGVLETGQVAIEQYRQIIRDNPRMSKQAAAVLHAGLEHIDQACGLKMRSTGFESYLTTPRAAMEEAEAVDEKTLGSRAAEIGAKILTWIKKLIEVATDMWQKYQVGLGALRDKCVELRKQKFPTEGTIKLQPAPAELFIEGEFAGDFLTPEEERLPVQLGNYYTTFTKEVGRRLRGVFAGRPPAEITLILEAMRKEDKLFSKLPGSKWIFSEAGKLQLGEGDAEAPESYDVDISEFKPEALLDAMIKSIDKFLELDTVGQFKAFTDEVTQGLIGYRKRNAKDVDEAKFQEIQQSVIDNSIKLFDVDSYFSILKQIGVLYNARYKLCAKISTMNSKEA